MISSEYKITHTQYKFTPAMPESKLSHLAMVFHSVYVHVCVFMCVCIYMHPYVHEYFLQRHSVIPARANNNSRRLIISDVPSSSLRSTIIKMNKMPAPCVRRFFISTQAHLDLGHVHRDSLYPTAL